MRIGFGSIIRDSNGRVVACCSQVCEANFDLDTTKAIAVWKGISFGIDCGLVCFVVETDSDTVINNIVKGGNSDSRYGCILDYVAALVLASRNVTYLNTSRKANRVVGILANEALKISNKVILMKDAPLAIRYLVESEQRG
ncbi:hypothetical protein LWI28_003171 [Acer negundo]|uniref:RNase H type-1 domain-containing protein n=1 Tax=Acer negundo TaxID=4023 RepID=A0AAD5NZ02_ACENE|nr:hypothetical protein LWI28_003171 [Acer negundo]